MSAAYSASNTPQAIEHAVVDETPDRSRSRVTLRRSRKSLPDTLSKRKTEIHQALANSPLVVGAKRIREKSRERKANRESSAPVPAISTVSSPLPVDSTAKTKTSISRELTTDCSSGTILSSGDAARKFRILSTPFLRSFANLISRPTATASSVGADAVYSDSNQKPLDLQISELMGETPDLSILATSGPVFGSSLESQIQSPDHAGVPLILDALISALSLHGLRDVGLYRAPGRQKEINRFVCLVQLTSLNSDTLLCLDAWRDIRVLTGLVKLFLRRLSKPLLDMQSWEPLASIVPETSENCDCESIAYTLLSILTQLMKTFKDAAPASSSSSPNKVCRFATLDFLFSHLRSVVALQEVNQVSFECISICFGPVLFGTSTKITKINKILEFLLEHWSWFVSKASSSNRPSLAATVQYVREFQEVRTTGCATTSALDSSTPIDSIEPDEKQHFYDFLICELRSLFNRAGLMRSPSSSCLHNPLYSSPTPTRTSPRGLLRSRPRSSPRGLSRDAPPEISGSNTFSYLPPSKDDRIRSSSRSISRNSSFGTSRTVLQSPF